MRAPGDLAPAGGTLVFTQAPSSAGDGWRAHYQDGGRTSRRDRWRPWCEFRLNPPRDLPAALPTTWDVVSVYRDRWATGRLSPRGFQLADEPPELVEYRTDLTLKADDYRGRLRCVRVEPEGFGRYPGVSDMRRILGTAAELRRGRS